MWALCTAPCKVLCWRRPALELRAGVQSVSQRGRRGGAEGGKETQKGGGGKGRRRRQRSSDRQEGGTTNNSPPARPPTRPPTPGPPSRPPTIVDEVVARRLRQPAGHGELPAARELHVQWQHQHLDQEPIPGGRAGRAAQGGRGARAGGRVDSLTPSPPLSLAHARARSQTHGHGAVPGVAGLAGSGGPGWAPWRSETSPGPHATPRRCTPAPACP